MRRRRRLLADPEAKLRKPKQSKPRRAKLKQPATGYTIYRSGRKPKHWLARVGGLDALRAFFDQRKGSVRIKRVNNYSTHVPQAELSKVVCAHDPGTVIEAYEVTEVVFVVRS